MWEKLSEVEDPETNETTITTSCRLNVPGGWIIRTIIVSRYHSGPHVSQVFVPDEAHVWKPK